MRRKVDKSVFQEQMANASRFTLSKLTSISSLQNAYLQIDSKQISITTTNLKDFFHTTIKTKGKEKKDAVVDVRKITEFLHHLPKEEIEIFFSGSQLEIKQGKTKGSFPTTSAKDFPTIPKMEGEKRVVPQKMIHKTLPLVLFASSTDEARPVLSGVHFAQKDKKLYIVATDGFRLSLVTHDPIKGLEDSIIASSVLQEVFRLAKGEKDVSLVVSNDGKSLQFKLEGTTIHTQVIEGEFPPFERVLPKNYTTKVMVEKKAFLRNMKTTAVFARESANIVVFEMRKDGLYIQPKDTTNVGTEIYQEATIEGSLQRISFNYKFVIDFLNSVDEDSVVFEMTDPNAPCVFRPLKNKHFLHIIMPVRTEDGE